MTAGATASRVDWRIGATAAVGVTAAVGMMLLGMQPRLVLVAFVVLIVSATTWLLVDVGSASEPLLWHDHGSGETTSSRPDRRVLMLRARLKRNARTNRRVGGGSAEPDEHELAISDTLVAVIDDHLCAEHGLDIELAPDAAAAVIGPELTRFMTDPSARRSMTQRRALARTVALIEALERPSAPGSQ
ncbi:hypothetical protein [Ilumatobacter coccineus]|uniref:Uncharacterized protein n=1 Tax=Ilumatobacter coccineus (strain NBRC 103263 / KCTC 29153 / YM16-304) TaxID=1313172 RepID=A0A6C7E2B2_ILUCY|nr:hypothetical protein [Ilumatobacter coccineus]BAN00953.1 hypothetical protein YM304_06390 [Ilumatobacter coccineus YM16-304]